jgi:micrococcal nuclease
MNRRRVHEPGDGSLAGRRRRRFRGRPYRSLAAGLVVAALVAYRVFFGPTPPPPPTLPSEGPHRVVRVIDGDTIIVAPHDTIRLIGVDTPETVKPEHPVEPWGPEATAFTRQFLAGGSARLTFDRERTDRFGRYLAYVWVDERLLNEELLRNGLGRWEPHFHYRESMKRRFRQAQQAAEREHLGIWSEDEAP